MGRVVDLQRLAVGGVHPVDDRGRRGDEVHLEFAFQAFLDDLHMQQAQEAAAEAEAQGLGGLGLEAEGGVVELELFQRGLEVLVIVGFRGIEAAEHHGLHFLEAGHGLGGRIGRQGDGIAHAGIAQGLDAAAKEAHLTGVQFLHVRGLGREHAQAQHFIFLAGAHEAHHVAQFHPAVHHTEEHHHALVAVVPGVEDQGLEGGVQIAARRGQTVDDGFQHGVHAQTGLGGHGQGVGAVQADGFLDLFLDAVHLGAGQVDLVQHGHDLVVVVQGQIDVGQGLGLHALGGVHHQQRAFAGGQGTRHFVVEVHVSGRVDEVQLIFLSVGSHIGDAHGLRLDGDAALAFQIHLVQVLLAGLALADDLGQLKDAVGKGGLAVVDMGDDAEIANMIQTGHGTRDCDRVESRGKRCRQSRGPAGKV